MLALASGLLSVVSASLPSLPVEKLLLALLRRTALRRAHGDAVPATHAS